MNSFNAKNFKFYSKFGFLQMKLVLKIFSRKVIVDEKDLIFSRPLGEDVKTSAFMTSLTDVLYRNKKTYKQFVLQICKEKLMTVNIVMYFPKNSYLKDTFSRKLNELSTAGIIQYWVKKYADERFLNVEAGNFRNQKLSIEKLSGVFNIWLIGLAISILSFVLELIIAKIRKAFKLR